MTARTRAFTFSADAEPGEGQNNVQRRALTTPFGDFWLLGGASLVVWLVMIAAQGFRSAWAVDQHFKNLTFTTASLSLLVNYPHFVMSYKLAYTRGRTFVTAHPWQLVIVPTLLVATFTWAFFRYNVPVSQLSGVITFQHLLDKWGNNARVFAGPRLGDLLFALAFNVMLFTVGWHYSKQVFGCMMVYAHFDAYPLSKLQRQIIKASLLNIWWLNFAYSNATGRQQTFSQFTYYSLALPNVAIRVTGAMVVIGAVLVVYSVFWKNYRNSRQLPSINMLVPFVALFIWWLPQTRQFEFYFLLTPLFHSLQYLAFVYKLEDSRLRTVRYPEIRATALIACVVVTGWLVFELVPNQIDTALGTFKSWQMFFFFTAAMLFINIHHYFIDNVLWRFRDENVQKYLLT
jgi:hypothetical protein